MQSYLILKYPHNSCAEAKEAALSGCEEASGLD
jgi:hypothetical protein